MTLLRNLVVILLGSLVSHSIPAQMATGGYRVEIELFSGDVLIGQPVVTTRAGQPVTVQTNAPNGYALKLTVSPSVNKMDSTDTAMQIRLKRNGEFVDVAAPVIRSPLGIKAHFETMGSSKNGEPPLKLNLVVKPVD